jgi:DNA-binding LacI/PurR family transcriptional regulator
MHRLPQKSSLVSQAAAILRERIEAGEWHNWLPGEHELCSQMRVARMTLRRALEQLQRAGLVRASQGKRREIIARRRRRGPAATGRVLLLTPVALHFLPPFDAFWANALRETLEESGYHLEIHADRGPFGRGRGASLDRLMTQFRPVGCVLIYSTRNMQLWFSRRKFPCVIVGSRHPDVDLPSVDKAHRAICRHAVGLFLARDHRQLALVSPESGAAGDLESEEGFNEGLAQTTRCDVRGSVVRHDGSVADICTKLHTLFRRQDRPTGLLVSRSLNVLTVVGHLMRESLRLPQDVALISRDHDPFLERMVPSVARYIVSPEGMASRVSSAVLEIVQTGLVSPANHQIMPEFTEGESLGPKRVDSAAAESRRAG